MGVSLHQSRSKTEYNILLTTYFYVRPWAKSPMANAKYLDCILTDLQGNIGIWDAVVKEEYKHGYSYSYEDSYGSDYEAAYLIAYDTAWNSSSKGTAFDSVCHIINDASESNFRYIRAWDVARNAMLALIAWEDCGYLLEQDPESVRMLGLLGNHAANLLLPACIALKTKTI